MVAERIVVMISMAVAVGNVTDAVLAEGGRSESVSTVAVDLGHDAAAKGERGEGVVVCEEDHGVNELRQGPAVLLGLQKALEKTTRKTLEKPNNDLLSVTFEEV